MALLLAGALLLGTAVPGVAAPLAEGPSPGGAAVRSLILPGWGQATNRRWVKAVVFFGAYSGLWAWAVALNQDKQDAQGRLNAASEEEQFVLLQEVEDLKDQRNAKFWFAGLTLLLSVTDAFVDAHLRGFDDRIDAEVGWLPGDPGEDGMIGLQVTTVIGETPARARR